MKSIVQNHLLLPLHEARGSLMKQSLLRDWEWKLWFLWPNGSFSLLQSGELEKKKNKTQRAQICGSTVTATSLCSSSTVWVLFPSCCFSVPHFPTPSVCVLIHIHVVCFMVCVFLQPTDLLQNDRKQTQEDRRVGTQIKARCMVNMWMDRWMGRLTDMWTKKIDRVVDNGIGQ